MELIFKTLFIYFLIILILRFMGKREIGQLGLFDFVVLLLIADVSGIAIDEESSFFFNLLPVLTLAIIQKILAIVSLKINFIRNIIDGKESIIIYNGKLNIKEIKKQKYNVNDLITQLRLKNVKSLSQVEHLILENNGEISVFLYENNSDKVDSSTSNSSINQKESSIVNANNFSENISVYPLIISGQIQKDNIKLLNISEKWINNELSKMNLTIKDVYFGNLEYGKLFIVETCEI